MGDLVAGKLLCVGLGGAIKAGLLAAGAGRASTAQTVLQRRSQCGTGVELCLQVLELQGTEASVS